MKIALVHDFLREYGGAERVLTALHELWPEAPIFTAFVDWKGLGPHVVALKQWDIRESWVTRNPFVKKFHSPLRFLAPKIWESFDVSGYDVVISSSGWYISRGIITKKPTVHICYLHHPPRHLYGYQTAVDWQKHWLVRTYAHIINHFLRMYDYQTAQAVDYFIANSKETKRRISKFYRRESIVIYPPAEIQNSHKRAALSWLKRQPLSNFSSLPLDYFLSVCRLARAKHVDLIIQACQKLHLPLVIVGKGKEEIHLRKIASVETGHAPSLQGKIAFLGEVKDEELPEIYANAKAFISASEDEEFGIAAVEAMGYGKPVIAYRSGGLVETVIEGKTGMFFDELSADSLVKAIKCLNDLNHLNMEGACIKQAEKFSKERFKKEIKEFVSLKYLG